MLNRLEMNESVTRNSCGSLRNYLPLKRLKLNKGRLFYGNVRYLNNFHRKDARSEQSLWFIVELCRLKKFLAKQMNAECCELVASPKAVRKHLGPTFSTSDQFWIHNSSLANKSNLNYFAHRFVYVLCPFFLVYLAIKHKWRFVFAFFFQYCDLMRDFNAVSLGYNGKRHDF